MGLLIEFKKAKGLVDGFVIKLNGLEPEILGVANATLQPNNKVYLGEGKATATIGFDFFYSVDDARDQVERMYEQLIDEAKTRLSEFKKKRKELLKK